MRDASVAAVESDDEETEDRAERKRNGSERSVRERLRSAEDG